MWASPALRPFPGPAALGAPAGPTQRWEFRNLSDTDSGKGFPFLVKVSIYRPRENSHRISRRKSPAPARPESPPIQPLCLLNLFSLFPQFPPFWNGMEPPPRSLCGRGKTASTRAEGPPSPAPALCPAALRPVLSLQQPPPRGCRRDPSRRWPLPAGPLPWRCGTRVPEAVSFHQLVVLRFVLCFQRKTHTGTLGLLLGVHRQQ